MGYPTKFEYPQLARACELVYYGIPCLMTHSDVSYPSKNGPIPDAGAISALISNMTGIPPFRTFGKTESDSYAAAVNPSIGNALLVGDRLGNDMKLGSVLGLEMVLIQPAPPEDVREWLEIFESVDFLILSVD